MNNLNDAVVRCFVAASLAMTTPRRHDERGDVPGWVMITVMTAGLVAIIAQFAGPELVRMLRAAFAKVQ